MRSRTSRLRVNPLIVQTHLGGPHARAMTFGEAATVAIRALLAGNAEPGPSWSGLTCHIHPLPSRHGVGKDGFGGLGGGRASGGRRARRCAGAGPDDLSLHLRRAPRPLERYRRARLQPLRRGDRRFGLQHGRFLPAFHPQPVPRHRSAGRLLPLRLRRPRLQSALLLRLEARPAVRLREPGQHARARTRYPLRASTATRSTSASPCRAARRAATRSGTSSATTSRRRTFRIHPDSRGAEEDDLYSPAIDAKSIRPGTVIYDPNGHVATVYKVEPDGRIHYIDAHPDSSLTHGFYDLRFVRAFPGMSAGFKNWRPAKLVGARPLADGSFAGGHVVPASNDEIADFSLEQFYGNGSEAGRRPRLARGHVHAERRVARLVRLRPRQARRRQAAVRSAARGRRHDRFQLRRSARPRRRRRSGA